MFTGIIEHLGTVISNESTGTAHKLMLASPFTLVQPGESIAVNGVCLTVLPNEENLVFDVSPETLKVTNLGALKIGAKVHLERAMSANARFGGHYVSGHVDTTAVIKEKRTLDECLELVISGFKPEETRFLLAKGSISLDGVSLTINAVESEEVTLLLIPHTLANTTLKEKQTGEYLNVEFDYLTRVIAHQLTL